MPRPWKWGFCMLWVDEAAKLPFSEKNCHLKGSSESYWRPALGIKIDGCCAVPLLPLYRCTIRGTWKHPKALNSESKVYVYWRFTNILIASQKILLKIDFKVSFPMNFHCWFLSFLGPKIYILQNFRALYSLQFWQKEKLILVFSLLLKSGTWLTRGRHIAQ